MTDKRYAGIISLAVIAILSAFTIWGTDFFSSFGKDKKESIDVAGATGIVEAAKLVDNDGNTTGYEVVVNPTGYAGEVNFTLTFEADGKTMTAFELGENNETPTLGGKVAEDAFKSQFNGLVAPVTIGEAKEEESKIEAVAGATITSEAVVTGVNNAYDFLQSIN